MKVLLVGEDNPHSLDPRLALAPLPRGAAGDRLRRVLGMTVKEYLMEFDRLNLCRKAWDRQEAAKVAQLVMHTMPGRRLVLLGRKVAEAFGLAYIPFTRSGQCLVLPHPSGRCRTWNDLDSRSRARAAVHGMMLESGQGGV